MTSQNQKVKESILVRGVASSIQAMSMPKLDNVIDLFKKVGIKLKVNNNSI